MAAPTYTTDLTNITQAGSGSYDEVNGYIQGSGIDIPEADYYIQGIDCTSQQVTKSGLASLVFDYGSGITIGADECVFLWHVFLPANALTSFSTGGMRLIIATDMANFDAWNVGGGEYARNPYGGWVNAVVDPTFTPDDSLGTHTTHQWFGSGINTTTGISKGQPHSIDAIRYGRGELIFLNGDISNGYGTFTGAASVNDSQDNRWGLLQTQAGGFLWKGLMSLGSGATLVDFRDSNKNIIIDDTPRTYSTFNKIEINNASSNVDWTGINISSLGPSAPGYFECVDNATVDLIGCSFTDMGIFTFQSNTTCNGTTFRRTKRVNQGGSTITSCIFDSTEPLSATDLGIVSYCDFTMPAASGHGIILDSNVTTPVSFDFNGCTFTGYEAVSGTNYAAIYNNTGGAVTINVGGNGDTPTIRNGTSATTTVVNARTLTLTGLVSASEVRIYEAGTQTELTGIENTVAVSGTQFSYSFPFSDAGNLVDVVVHHIDYVYYRINNFPLPSTSSSVPIQQSFDRNYSNPI